MGQKWDRGVPGVEFWEAILGAMKPGAHLLAFGGTRTFHRLTCAIEDAGFEIRDCLMWVYGTGFPKSLDVSKAIDKAAGVERSVVGSKAVSCGTGKDFGKAVGTGHKGTTIDITAPATDASKQWEGWGTALKPAWEPIILARKPLVGTVAANVLEHGTGGINVDACRVPASGRPKVVAPGTGKGGRSSYDMGSCRLDPDGKTDQGRWPANLIHDGSDEVLELFPKAGGGFGVRGSGSMDERTSYAPPGQNQVVGYGDEGSAARFFYCVKASKAERGEGNTHPTVKPIALMRYLCRLVAPLGGVILDPFMGSGSTLIAAQQEGFQSIGIDRDEKHCQIAFNRLIGDRWPALK